MVHPEIILDHRARLEQIQLEAAQRRERALIDQRSPENSADTRVRIWERLHQVRLPKDPLHPILRQVAEHTALTLDEVRQVQQSRLPQVVPAAPTP
jgi:hypothetical protein